MVLLHPLASLHPSHSRANMRKSSRTGTARLWIYKETIGWLQVAEPHPCPRHDS